jgi:hypothetical protein
MPSHYVYGSFKHPLSILATRCDTGNRSFGIEKEPASLWEHTELPNIWQAIVSACCISSMTAINIAQVVKWRKYRAVLLG